MNFVMYAPVNAWTKLDEMVEQLAHGLTSPAIARRALPVRPLPGARGEPTLDAQTARSQAEDVPAATDLHFFVEGMRVGNERALEGLYDATVSKLFALASSILRDSRDAEEAVCSTYAYAWSNIGRYDGGRASVLGWLLMLCRSRSLDRLRQRRLAAPTVDVSEINDLQAEQGAPDDVLALMQQQSRVHAALAVLTPARRKVVSLAFLQGLTGPEIAELTGMPLSTVKSHVRRGLVQLRETLESV